MRSPIPAGRGLGFSGAMRVGGLVAAVAQRAGGDAELEAARPALLEIAIELEGHADNAAASLLRRASWRRPPAGSCACRSPSTRPSWPGCRRSRRRRTGPGTPCGGSVSFADAVFNVGRTALLVAALAAGDVEALRWATADRLHQDQRFAAAVPARVALANGLEAGAWCGWLSGSGPTVCLLCDPRRRRRRSPRRCPPAGTPSS